MSIFTIADIDRSALSSLHREYKTWMHNTIKNLTTEQRLGGFDSGIPAVISDKFDFDGFVIDCGGTNTRVVSVTSNGGSETFQLIPNGSRNNLEWMSEISDSSDPLFAYFENIVRFIVSASNANPSSIKNIAVVWSNAGRVASHTDTMIKGVTILTTGIEARTDYRKGEPFTKNLTDGVDIGEIFLNACRQQQVFLERLILGNDTIFVATAATILPDAAGVNSSGANMATIFDFDRPRWVNLENGSRIAVPKALELPFEEEITDKSIESFIAGKWLTKRFITVLLAFLHGLPAQNEHQGKELIVSLFTRSTVIQDFRAEDFSELYHLSATLKGLDALSVEHVATFKAILGLFEHDGIDTQLVHEIASLVRFVGSRALALTAVLIANALTAAEIQGKAAPYRVAMDSRVLDGLDPYGVEVKKTLHYLIGEVELELLQEPQGMSIPIVGAAKSIQQFAK